MTGVPHERQLKGRKARNDQPLCTRVNKGKKEPRDQHHDNAELRPIFDCAGGDGHVTF